MRKYVLRFGDVWKGRGGGQELSAEVIRAPGSGTPFFDQSLCFKHISFACAPIEAFSAGLEMPNVFGHNES